ncbi:MAG: DUF6503 family protein [Bacteroidota bacterium]
MKTIYTLAFLFILAACSTPEQQSAPVTEKEVTKPYTLAKPKSEWVKERVAASKQRLESTPGGKLVWNAMEFHGGLANWWNNGPLYFRFNYQPKPGTGTPRDTYETADYWTSKTRHQRVSNPAEEYGWDGKVSWRFPKEVEIPYNTRFWSLTPYYFAGMPFVFADEGVNLTQEANQTYEGTDYHIVRATFGEGVGDAPDDYYVLYIDPETFRLSAIRYVVSYPAYFKKGEHPQEKFMTYEGQQEISGIIFPKEHRTFMWEADGSIGEYVTDITLSDVAYKPDTEQSYFEMPAKSFVMDGLK